MLAKTENKGSVASEELYLPSVPECLRYWLRSVPHPLIAPGSRPQRDSSPCGESAARHLTKQLKQKDGNLSIRGMFEIENTELIQYVNVSYHDPCVSVTVASKNLPSMNLLEKMLSK